MVAVVQGCKLYSTLLVTSLHVRWFCINRKGGTGGGGWSHLQSAVHMAAAWLGCKRSVVGTGWANSHPGCMNELRKHYTL